MPRGPSTNFVKASLPSSNIVLVSWLLADFVEGCPAFPLWAIPLVFILEILRPTGCGRMGPLVIKMPLTGALVDIIRGPAVPYGMSRAWARVWGQALCCK